MRLQMGFAGLFLGLGMWSASAQDLYRLQVNDRVEVWTSAEPSLQRTAAIGPDGWLSLPLVGHIEVAGLTIPELERQLQERLKDFFKEAIDLTVMLQPGEERTQTIYVTGDVATPGHYPFQPGMIVLHGVSMAGGLRIDASTGADEQRIVEARGSITRETNRIEALDAQIARITAELSGGELPGDSSDSMGREQRILAARRSEEAVLLKARNEALELRRSTTEAIRQQAASYATRIELAQKRIDAVTKLVNKGFANEAQLLELQGNLAALRADDLSLQVAFLGSQRELAAEIASAEIALEARRTQLQIELRDAQRDRDETLARRSASTRILEIVTNEATAGAEEPARPLAFRIIRTIDGSPTELSATQFSEIQSGDLILVGSPRQTEPEQQVPTRELSGAISHGAMLQ